MLTLKDSCYAVAFALCAVLLTATWWVIVSHSTAVPVGLWLACETAFFLRQQVRYHTLNIINPKQPEDNAEKRIEQFLTLKDVVDIREFLSGWFMNAPFEQLLRENVLDFIAYGFWYTERASMDTATQATVLKTLERIESVFSILVPPGFNPELQFMAHLWQPLRVVHKPLAIHVLSEATLVLTHAALTVLGFKRYHIAGFNYWARGAEPVTTGAEESSRGGSWLHLANDREDEEVQLTRAMQAPRVDPFGEAIRSHHLSQGSSTHSTRSPHTSDHRQRLHAAIASAAAAAHTGFHAIATAAVGSGVAELLDDKASPFPPPFPVARASAPQMLNLPEASGGSFWRDAFTSAVFGQALPRPQDLATLCITPPGTPGSVAGRSSSSTGGELMPILPHVADSAAPAAEFPPPPLLPPPREQLVQRHVARPQRASQLPPVSTATARPGRAAPVVFLHGVGMGMLPYILFLRKIVLTFPTSPVFVMEIRHVSLRLCTQARTVDDVVRALATMLRRHREAGAHFVAHSFGTFMVAHMRHLYPAAVKSALLCDPVCMLTCCPQLLHNFIYRSVGPLELLRNPFAALKMMIARDLIIAEAICRHFWWHTHMLWPDELPAPTLLSLSYSDELVPCDLVQRQVQKDLLSASGGERGVGSEAPVARSHVRVVVSDGPHGVFVVRPTLQDRLLREYSTMIAAVHGA